MTTKKQFNKPLFASRIKRERLAKALAREMKQEPFGYVHLPAPKCRFWG